MRSFCDIKGASFLWVSLRHDLTANFEKLCCVEHREKELSGLVFFITLKVKGGGGVTPCSTVPDQLSF